jgi:hypothetical protein
MARTSEKSAVAEPTTKRGKQGANQSEFIRAFLTDNPQGAAAQAAKQWQESGHESRLNRSLFYQIRTKMGLKSQDSSARGRQGSDDAPNRSEYIRKNLLENPELSALEIARLWTQEGFPGTLKPALYYQVKRRMGLSSRRRGPKARAAARTIRPLIATGRNNSQEQYLRLELALDALIRDAERLGDNQLSLALRQARRRVASQLV